jgi:hypothetical protein
MSNLGLNYIDNFISQSEEIELIDNIQLYRNNNLKSIASYGDNNYDSLYFGERYKKGSQEFPDFLNTLCDRLIQQNLLQEYPFGIAINQYKKGQKIGAHIDKEISGPIVSILSLGSVSTMVFKKKNHPDIVQILSPTSLVQMKDEIRLQWTHEILPVPDLRFSVIFRSLK